MVVGGGSTGSSPARRRDRLTPASRPGRRALGVALDAGELTREQHARIVAQGEVRQQRGGGVEVRVPVNGAEAEELRVLEAGDHAKDALLLGIAKPRLKSHEVPHAAGAILHAKLDDGVRLAPGAWIDETDGLHRPEAQRLAASSRHLLGGHASLEVRHGVELVRRRLIGGGERIDERLILLARHRAIQVRAGRSRPPSSPCRSARHGRRRRVDRVVRDDRRDGVVESQRLDVPVVLEWIASALEVSGTGGDDAR
jgi:hypothetical protein